MQQRKQTSHKIVVVHLITKTNNGRLPTKAFEQNLKFRGKKVPDQIFILIPADPEVVARYDVQP